MPTLIAGNDDRPNGRWNQDSGSAHEGTENICMTQECVRTGKLRSTKKYGGKIADFGKEREVFRWDLGFACPA